MTKFITALDTISGQTGPVPENYLTLPGMGEHLVQVDEGTKSYEPELHKPTDAKEYKSRKAKAVASDPSPVETDETPKDTLDSEIQ